MADLTGIDYRTLHNWLKRGLLIPSHQSANGSGSVNLFAPEDALQLYVLADLRRAGVEMRVLERAARPLREVIQHPVGAELLLIGEDIEVLTSIGDIEVLTSIGDIEHAVDERGPLLLYGLARARRMIESLAAPAQAA